MFPLTLGLLYCIVSTITLLQYLFIALLIPLLDVINLEAVCNACKFYEEDVAACVWILTTGEPGGLQGLITYLCVPLLRVWGVGCVASVISRPREAVDDVVGVESCRSGDDREGMEWKIKSSNNFV